MTDSQQKTLQHAADRGYYSVPRDITAEELADEFDVSH
ncbi:helix-turn-helix domain-containing protein [Haladaptatus caseinilyticus]|nr:helix-turn-helix domain-containing protein [Haladaptatus caseinilyticus]